MHCSSDEGKKFRTENYTLKNEHCRLHAVVQINKTPKQKSWIIFQHIVFWCHKHECDMLNLDNFLFWLLYEQLILITHCDGYVDTNVYPALLPRKRKTTFQKWCFDESVSLLAALLSHRKQRLACGSSAAFGEVGVHHIAAAAYAILSHFSHCTYVLSGSF